MEEDLQTGVLIGMQYLPLKLWGKVYRYCVRPVLLYCSKAWELDVAYEVKLESAECQMIRMISVLNPGCFVYLM